MEILFRGKRIDNGEWVHGDFSRYPGEKSIIMVDLLEEEDYWVSSETVGQDTGLNDKNGVKIFEGDVVTVDYDFIETHSMGNVEDGTLEVWDEYRGGIHEIGEVKFERATFVVQELDLGIFEDSEIEVIGNIHDNPELLDG